MAENNKNKPPSDPIQQRIHSWRMRGEELRTIASTMANERAVASLISQAEEWERMALAAERQRGTSDESIIAP